MDPSQLLGSPSLSTGDPWLDSILQGQFKSGGPSVGSGFTGSMPTGAPPGTSLATTTPQFQSPPQPTRNLPAVSPQRLPAAPSGNPMTAPSPGAFPIGGPLATGISLLANAPSTDADIGKQANKVGDYVDQSPWGKWLIDHDITSPSQKWDTGEPATQSPDALGSSVTKTATLGEKEPPPPPTINLPPFDVKPPGAFVRGPIPYDPKHTPAAAKGAKAPKAPKNVNLGYGAPPAPSSMFTTIDRPNADISGGPTRAGWLSASYDPATGTNRGAREPGGPARMGALDLSGIFSHPAVAAQAAAHPAVQGAMAAQAARAPIPMGGQHIRTPARVPVMQRKPPNGAGQLWPQGFL